MTSQIPSMACSLVFQKLLVGELWTYNLQKKKWNYLQFLTDSHAIVLHIYNIWYVNIWIQTREKYTKTKNHETLLSTNKKLLSQIDWLVFLQNLRKRNFHPLKRKICYDCDRTKKIYKIGTILYKKSWKCYIYIFSITEIIVRKKMKVSASIDSNYTHDKAARKIRVWSVPKFIYIISIRMKLFLIHTS